MLTSLPHTFLELLASKDELVRLVLRAVHPETRRALTPNRQPIRLTLDFQQQSRYRSMKLWMIDVIEKCSSTTTKNKALDLYVLNTDISEMVDTVRYYSNGVSSRDLCRSAARLGLISVLQWYHDNDAGYGSSDPRYPSIFDNNAWMWIEAIESGQLDVLKWFHAHNFLRKGDRDLCITAIKHGHLHILKWACSTGYYLNSTPYDWKGTAWGVAVENGHLPILKWLHDEGYELIWDRICSSAARHGKLNIFVWALGMKGGSWDHPYVMMDVATYGHVHIMQWAQVNGYEDKLRDPLLYESAIIHGHMNVVMWLHSQGYPWDTMRCMRFAAFSAQLDALKWMHSIGCQFGHQVYISGAGGASIDILNWLRDVIDCPRSPDAWRAVVMSEYKNKDSVASVLDWLLADGCPWDSGEAGRESLEGEFDNCAECIEWFNAHGYPW